MENLTDMAVGLLMPAASIATSFYSMYLCSAFAMCFSAYLIAKFFKQVSKQSSMLNGLMVTFDICVPVLTVYAGFFSIFYGVFGSSW